MYKLFCIVVFCLIYSFAKADWDLFPLNQKSYYSIQYSGQEMITLVAFDSTVQRSGYQSVFPNRKYPGVGIENCYNAVIDFSIMNWNLNETEFDSLIYSGDSIILASQMYFFPNKSVGESWRISGQLQNGFTDIEFTCTNASVQSFLGISDSVKEFTIATYNGANLISSTLTGFVIRLSKNYGLLDYLNFGYLQDHSKLVHYLIGIEDSINNNGFAAPTYLDFFPYQVGDVLNWLTESHPLFPTPWTYLYFKDSIISVNISPDTLSYECIRHSYHLPSGIYSIDTIEEFVTVDYFKSILESPPQWISITPKNSFGGKDIAFSENYFVENDSSLTYKIRHNGTSVDTSTCQVGQATDVAEHYTYNTYQGLMEYCDDAFFYHCTNLIGAFIGGRVYGDTVLITNINKIAKPTSLRLYPNPAQNKLCLSFSNGQSQSSRIEIMNLSGSILYTEVIELSSENCSAELNLEGFANGFYILSVADVSGKNAMRQKFIVQH